MAEKTLATLIKLAQRQLDEARRHVNDLESQIAALEAEHEGLDVKLAVEEVRAGEFEEARFGFGAYVASVRQKQQQILRAKRDLERELTVAKEVVRNGFAEMKRYEELARQRAERAAAAAAQAEQAELDEIGRRRA